jgi:hypothetical protein
MPNGLTLLAGEGAFTATEKKILNDNAGLTVDLTGEQTLTNKRTPKVETIITGDGAITIADGLVTLTKGSAAAITLAAPTAAQAGTVIVITAGSAFAHVVTATGLLEDGVVGGAKNTATFAAFRGATITLVASQLKWNVVSKNVVTVA